MNRKQKMALAVWAGLMVAAFGWFYVRLGQRRVKLESVEDDLRRCGELRLGMDETEAIQLMGQLQARVSVPSSTPGLADTELQFASDDPGVALRARLDGGTGRLIEAVCGSAVLKANDAFLKSLAPSRPAVGTDAARP